jgi:hypothetical protein
MGQAGERRQRLSHRVRRLQDVCWWSQRMKSDVAIMDWEEQKRGS